MQPWLKIQRTGLILFLAFAILLLIYALGFISDVYLFYAYGSKGLIDFYNEMQAINTTLLWKAVTTIIFAIILFLLGLGRYPAGLFTLIFVVIISAVSLFFAIDSFVHLTAAHEKYANLDLSSLNRYIERGAIKYQYSTFTYDLGRVVYTLFSCVSLFMVISVIRNAVKVQYPKRKPYEGK